MFASKVTLIALIPFFATLASATLAPRVSRALCRYVCPTTDQNGQSLKDSNENGGGSTLICRYTNPDNRNCQYGRYSGKLINDNDSGHCPSTARNPNGCAGAAERDVEDRKRTFEAVNAVKSKLEAIHGAKEGMEKRRRRHQR